MTRGQTAATGEKRVKRRERRPLVGLSRPATLSNCGEFLKPLATAARRKARRSTRVTTSGMVTTRRMSQWIIRSQVLRPGAPSRRHRPGGGARGIGMQFND